MILAKEESYGEISNGGLNKEKSPLSVLAQLRGFFLLLTSCIARRHAVKGPLKEPFYRMKTTITYLAI